MDERRLTFIVVPHGDLETRTIEVSYRRLKLLLVAVFLLLVVFVVIVSSWWYVAAQAARVSGLEEEVDRLEEERAKVAELAGTLADVEAQYERVRRLLGADVTPGGREPLLPPLRGRESGSSGGSDGAVLDPGIPNSWPLTRSGYITQALTADGVQPHPGLDIAVPKDSYIRAAGAGVVQAAGTDSIYGRYVLIEHAGGYESMYGHASRIFVAAGDSVERNEVIALSGSTGRSTAPHLHFELRKNGEPIDPLPIIREP